MTPEQRTRAIVHNAADRALSSRGHWVPLSVRVAITDSVLAALTEQGYAIVPATAPQPSETPQDAQTGDGGISGRPDLPNGSAGLSDAHAEEALARVVQHARALAGYRPVEADALAAVILGLDPRDCRPGAALTALTREDAT